MLHGNRTVTAGQVERSFRQGDVAVAKRRLRQLIQQGSIPRFLRAVQLLKGSKKKVYHFVEWHSGDAKLLMAPTSYTQLCLYEDLGEVCKHCVFFIPWKGPLAWTNNLANRNPCSMDLRQMANSVVNRCDTSCRHPHCHFA